MRRPSNPESRIPNPGNIQELLSHWRKLAWLGAAILVLLTSDGMLTKYGPPRVVTAILREWRKAGMPSVATAASFSVSAGSFATEGKAATFAAALDSSGLPILVRVRPDDHRYQVLVGPYVSTDEAERAQRTLAAWGFGESRLVVDDTMRSPSTASVFGVGEKSNSVVMVAAPGVLSVVFEMTGAPKTVEAKRTSAVTIDVEIAGPNKAAVGADLPPSPKASADHRSLGGGGQVGPPETLALPDGVVLVQDLSIQSDSASSSLRARLVVPGDVQSRLRLEGQRAYLDLAWPKAPWTITGAGQAGKAGRAGEAVPRPGAAERAATEADRASSAALAAAEARFHEIEPFLASANDSDMNVQAALHRSLDALRTSVEQLPPSDERAALLADIDIAKP